MSKIVRFVNERKIVFPLTLLFFVVCFFCVFCFIHYSDGDDSIFAEMTSSRAYLEYLGFRYETWTGRMGGESLVYLVFRYGGIWFWRFANAVMVVALPLCLMRLVMIVAGLRDSLTWEKLRLFAVLMAGYLLMDVMTFGHSAVWVNGSIFYTWCIVCGLVSIVPAVKYLYADGYKRSELLYAVPLGIVAVMSIEQIGAVLLSFLALILFSGAIKKRPPRVDVGLLAQFVAMFIAMVVLFLAPGNVVRTTASYGDWLPPEFLQLSSCEHAFLTFQWLVSSFANEGRLFLLCIWILGGMLLLQQRDSLKNVPLKWLAPALLFSLVALLPFAKIDVLSNVGLAYIDPAVKLEVLPSWAAMTLMNRVALAIWTLAVLFTIPFLWKVSGKSAMLVLAFLAGICSELIMHFSPTIYASGERVYYVTSLLMLFVILRLFLQVERKKWKNIFVLAVILFGALNALVQVGVILLKLKTA